MIANKADAMAEIGRLTQENATLRAEVERLREKWSATEVCRCTSTLWLMGTGSSDRIVCARPKWRLIGY